MQEQGYGPAKMLKGIQYKPCIALPHGCVYNMRGGLAIRWG
jgi:hypothetical protein